MLSQQSLTHISKIFCGDEDGLYSYKSGSELVRFFNTHFASNDTYGSGFPSRWIYVHNKFLTMINNNKFDKLLSTILDRKYLMKDLNITEVEAAEQSSKIFDTFNQTIKQDFCSIIVKNGNFFLQKEDDDFILIGEGGFAKVYKQKSTGLIHKKLHDDLLADKSNRSRFKREFDITKSLADIFGVIEAYSFDDSKCSYTMEQAEFTLEYYISSPNITDEVKLNCIRQILSIMTVVHDRQVIHRDLSPNNIFVIHGKIKIADFGLGKDLSIFASHQTLHTNAVGQWHYCAPEQFNMLKEGSKKSDVFSIGKIINFIMTLNPNNSNHMFRSTTMQATNENFEYRFSDTKELSVFLEKSIELKNNNENIILIKNKIKHGQFDPSVEDYIYELSATKICFSLINEKHFDICLIHFMKRTDMQAQHIIQSINSEYQTSATLFSNYDPFAHFTFNILRERFPFPYDVKVIAANILRFIAKDINRFCAQNWIEDLKKTEIEPSIEDILNS